MKNKKEQVLQKTLQPIQGSLDGTASKGKIFNVAATKIQSYCQLGLSA
jgi:hypothetical protein